MYIKIYTEILFSVIRIAKIERVEESLGETHSNTVLDSNVTQYHLYGKQADKIYQNYKCTFIHLYIHTNVQMYIYTFIHTKCYFDLALPHWEINLLNLLAQIHTDLCTKLFTTASFVTVKE